MCARRPNALSNDSRHVTGPRQHRPARLGPDQRFTGELPPVRATSHRGWLSAGRRLVGRETPQWTRTTRRKLCPAGGGSSRSTGEPRAPLALRRSVAATAGADDRRARAACRDPSGAANGDPARVWNVMRSRTIVFVTLGRHGAFDAANYACSASSNLAKPPSRLEGSAMLSRSWSNGSTPNSRGQASDRLFDRHRVDGHPFRAAVSTSSSGAQLASS